MHMHTHRQWTQKNSVFFFREQMVGVYGKFKWHMDKYAFLLKCAPMHHFMVFKVTPILT